LWVGLGLLSLGAVLCAGSLPSPLPESPVARPDLSLPPGQPVRRELRTGASDHFRLPLASGQVIDLQVEQDGIDVSLILWGPDGERLLALDTPTGDRGTERLSDLAEVGGIYRLEIRGGKVSGGRGSYVVRLASPRPAGPQDRWRAQACREYSRGESLKASSPRGALAPYKAAFRLWTHLGDREQAGIALYRSAWILLELGDERGALKAFERLRPIVEDPEMLLSVLNSVINLSTRLGETQRALRTGDQALKLARRSRNPSVQAAMLNNLGMVYRSLGESDLALTFFDESLKKWKEVGAHDEHARALSNRAEIVLALGNPKPALGMANEALRILEEAGAPGGVGDAYRIRGIAFRLIGSRTVALRHLEMACAQARLANSRWDEELSLNYLGSAYLEVGNLQQARAAFARAGESARQHGHRDNEAFSLSGHGHVLLQQGDAAGAIERFSRSQQLYERLGDPTALAHVLYGRALAEQSLGRIEESRASIDRALEIVEELREGLDQEHLRSHFIGVSSDFYDLRVDLLLRLHEQNPDRGFDAQAFAASEWRRARSLLELVRKMGAGLPRDLPEKSLRRQNLLRGRLLRLVQEKVLVGTGERRGSRSLAEIEREIEAALAEWEKLSEEMRRQSPAYAATNLPKLVGVREVQKLLDADTALVAYTAGEERSIVWWIERDALVVHQDLPPRAELEALADDVYDLLSGRAQTRQRALVEDRLEALGKALLGPLGDRLGRVRRIAVVADEVLQALPFSALPVPGSGELLVERHAIVQLPSASLAAELRARQQGRPGAPKIMAGFGDPVFGPSDERFPQEARRLRSTGERRNEIRRLPKSLREVNATQELVPAAKSRWFLGFEANLRAAMDPDLANYRYIHFATHAFVDPDNPNLSGIQLSPFDAQGRPLPEGGLLPFYEVYNLRFPADLVTLSACRTVDGPQIWGEGRLGMSRSFLYAGATRVLGTLWNVDDRDAAELMTLFYGFLLRDGKSPAVALQEAQNAMRAREETRSPYHWAGFVLQGDWR